MRDVSLVDNDEKFVELAKQLDQYELLSESDIRSFINAGKFREYNRGEVVIKEGEYDSWIYFLVSGRLEVIKDNKPVGQLKRIGDMFGEMGVIDGSPRSASIMAVEKSVVLGIDGAVIDHKLKSNDTGFCYIIYRLFAEVLAARLRETTRENMQLRQALAKFGMP